MTQKEYLYIIPKLVLHLHDTTQRVYNTLLWNKNIDVYGFSTQFYQEYIFIDLMSSSRK